MFPLLTAVPRVFRPYAVDDFPKVKIIPVFHLWLRPTLPNVPHRFRPNQRPAVA